MKILIENDTNTRRQLADSIIEYIFNSPVSYNGDDWRFENSINYLAQFLGDNIDYEDKQALKDKLSKFTLSTIMQIEQRIKDIQKDY